MRLTSEAVERALIGAITLDREALMAAVDVGLVADDFSVAGHASIYAEAIAIDRSGQRLDMATLNARMNRLGTAPATDYCVWLGDECEDPASASQYAKEIHGLAQARRLVALCASLRASATSGVSDPSAFLESAQAAWQGLWTNDTQSSYGSLQDALHESLKAIMARKGTKPELFGVTTGLADLDTLTSGLHPSVLYVVAARPGMGKTSLVMNAAVAAANSGVPVLVFSLEMTATQLTDRLLSGEARLEMPDLYGGKLTSYAHEDLTKASEKLNSATAHIAISDGAAQSITKIRATARRFASDTRYKSTRKIPGLIIVDYLQLARGETGQRYGNREAEVADVSKGLKQIAKDLRMPVLAAAQLNRRGDGSDGKPRPPVLSDLRESGQIEQDAETIAFIHSEKEEAAGDVELFVRKNRNGPVGRVCVYFDKRYLRFEGSSRREH